MAPRSDPVNRRTGPVAGGRGAEIGMRIKGLFKRDPAEAAARALYARVVEQARLADFYRDAGVPDTLDGRFDMIVLHAFLVLHRLKQEGQAQGPVGQALFDLMFADMDASLRELG